MSKRMFLFALCMMIVFSVGVPVCADDDFGAAASAADLVWYNDLQFDKSTGTIVRYRQNEFGGSVEIPAEIEGVPVTTIGAKTFAGSEIENVILPNSVLKIEKWAFDSCIYLREIKLSSSLKRIEDEAFNYCESLEKVEFPEGLTYIGNGAFSGCESLEDFVLPESLQTIGELAFFDARFCGSIRSIRVPANLTDIGEGAFSFRNLHAIEVAEGNPTYVVENGMLLNKDKTVLLSYNEKWKEACEIPDSITRIGSAAFAFCSLTNVTIPDHITEMGRSVFSSCSKLESVILPSAWTEIADAMFSSCESLQKVELPKNLTRIGEGAFHACYGLKEFTIPETVSVIGNAAFRRSGIREIIIPAAVKGIGDGAFSDTPLRKVTFNAENCEFVEMDDWDEMEIPVFRSCYSLTEIIIGENVRKIPDFAFVGLGGYLGNSALERVLIPKSVERIANNAFDENAKFTIYGNANSYAQQYAKENNIPFIVLESDKIFPSVHATKVKGRTVTVNIDFMREISDKRVLTALYDENDRIMVVDCQSITTPQSKAEVVLDYYTEDGIYTPPSHVKVFIWEGEDKFSPVGYVYPTVVSYY